MPLENGIRMNGGTLTCKLYMGKKCKPFLERVVDSDVLRRRHVFRSLGV